MTKFSTFAAILIAGTLTTAQVHDFSDPIN